MLFFSFSLFEEVFQQLPKSEIPSYIYLRRNSNVTTFEVVIIVARQKLLNNNQVAITNLHFSLSR